MGNEVSGGREGSQNAPSRKRKKRVGDDWEREGGNRSWARPVSGERKMRTSITRGF